MNDTDYFIDEFVAATLSKKLQNFYQNESSKGCNGQISPIPTDIRPIFKLFQPEEFDKNLRSDLDIFRPNTTQTGQIESLRIWLNKNDYYKADRMELFLRQISGCHSPVHFEIIGNSGEISIVFSFESRTLKIIETIISTNFPLAEIEPKPSLPIAKTLLNKKLIPLIRDYFPQPPYFRTLTSFPNIPFSSPLETIFSILNTLTEEELGIYRVTIHPFPEDENWHRNMEKLVGCEQIASQNNILQLYSESSENDFHAFGKTKKIGEEKANPDMPFISVKVALIAFVKSENYEEVSKKSDVFIKNYRYGGKALKVLTEKDFQKEIATEQNFIEATLNYQSFTQGMILNTLEAVSFVNIPEKIFTESRLNVKIAEGIKISEKLNSGKILLGECLYGHKSCPIYIPENAQGKHIHIIGKIGYGKSSLIENLVFEDIQNNIGLCVVDPHGDLIDSIISKIPERFTDRVIYFNPVEKDHFPCFNPFDNNRQDSNISMLAENFVYAFKKIFSHWGDRMERILRNVFYLLFQSQNLTLADIPALLSKTDEGEALREEHIESIENPIVRNFWESEFNSLGHNAVEPIHNKISKLLTNKNLNRIFSSRKNRFDIKKIMNEGKIFLIKIPTGILGIESADIIGSMLISLFHQEAINRANVPKQERIPFNLYIDEFHRFTGREIEDFIVDGRKYKVGVILAHQQRSQLLDSIDRILGNAYVLIALNNDYQEAKKTTKELPANVEPDDIMKLGIGEAVVKIGSEVAKVKLKPPAIEPKINFTETIKRWSFLDYYDNKSYNKENNLPETPSSTETGNKAERKKKRKRIYDTFD